MDIRKHSGFHLLNAASAIAGVLLVSETLNAKRYSSNWDVGLMATLAAGILLLLFAAVRVLRGRRILENRKANAAAMLAFAFCALIFIGTEAVLISDPYLHDASRAPAARVAVVLGCGVHPDGQPSLALVMRLSKALEYWRQHENVTVVVTGGMGANEPITEGKAMHDWLVDNGMPDSDILVEERSTSTNENFAYTEELLKGTELEGEPIVFVTSDFHVFRSRILAEHNGFSASALASPTPEVIWVNAHVREFMALYKSLALDLRW